MKIKCYDGPMDGAEYVLATDYKSTDRKPDGLWFDGTDEHGRNVQHQYSTGHHELEDGMVTLWFNYIGPVVDTGIEFETE